MRVVYCWVALWRTWPEVLDWVLYRPGGVCCAPTTNDDALIPDAGADWTVDLTRVTIDDLTIEQTVVFGAEGASPTLTVDSLTILGTGAVVEVTVSEDATLKTN